VLHVEPLVCDLLLYFAARPQRVLTREEIIDGVWRGRSVSDATISSCVKAARQVLGDSGRSQSWIRTVRGRGFEFLRPVEVADPTVSDAALSAPSERGVDTALPSTGANPRDVAAAVPVLAVLPLANLSDAVDDYFADGLTEDIITNLGRFRDLRVISGASTLRFRDRSVDLRELRNALGAGYVVQGTVRRAAGRVRISVQLIDAAAGLQLWGERYDSEMGDIFELQDAVTRQIAVTLGVRTQDVSLQRALTKRPNEMDAYDCILRARRYTWMLDAGMHAEARDLLERAVVLDPMSADAHALLANVYLGEHRFEMNPRPDPVGRALVHALAACSLDPLNAYARCWLAVTHFFRGENARFRAEAELALSLNPNDPETLADIGHYLAFMGDFERGAELSRRAQRLNPLHPGWYHFSFARLNYSRRDYDAVIADVERIGLPHFYWTHLLGAAAKGQAGHADAGASLARIFEVKSNFSAEVELRKWNAAPEDRDHILKGLRRAGLRG